MHPSTRLLSTPVRQSANCMLRRPWAQSQASVPIRPFSISTIRAKATGAQDTSDLPNQGKPQQGDTSGNSENALRKDGQDVVSHEAYKGVDARKGGEGGAATEQEGDSKRKKTKDEFPAAPDPGLGMQDERGRKGAK